ncbi:hypothetical protein EYC59_00360 [Candidatus Saccharibacteria bacterium]|nr:MAG: hypothetical protein EYC59_00360 [Candidatus Saccharibacteria bacterium]
MKRLLFVFGFVLLLLVPASHAAAFDPFAGFKDGGGGCHTTATNAVVCPTDGEDPISGTNGILRKVTNLIALIAGVVAVILVIISGFQFITSGGDSSKVASARSALVGAIIGVAIVLSAQAILVFVLKAT